MSVALHPSESLRGAPVESKRLVWAFALSLAIHACMWGGYTGGKRAFSWIEIHRPSWLVPLKLLHKKPQPLPKTPELPVLTLTPPPPAILQFVDVTPKAATAEPPKDAKFQSSRNSLAANPEADKDTGIPKITGERTDVIKTEDLPKTEVVKLQPILPPVAPPAPQEIPEETPKPKLAPGDLTVAKPDPQPRTGEGTTERPRPRTLKEARARMPDSTIPGRKMKQDGGVKRRLDVSAMDAKATLFGAYQERLVSAVVQRWYDLLEERAYTLENGGKVVVHFAVHYDGTVTGVKIAGNTTGAEVLGYVCVKAIEDPAPYDPWPSDMRHEIAKGVFDVEFTFIY